MNFRHFRAPVRTALAFVIALACFFPAHGLGQRVSKDPVAASRPPSHNEQMRKRLLAMDLNPPSPAPLPAAAVIERMMATSSRRSSQLTGFRGTRFYRLQYHGLFGTREATMKVIATYIAPDKRDFQVVSQTGSKLLLNRVLLKLLDSEREAYRDEAKIEISPANYQFESMGLQDVAAGDPCYVLGVRPRQETKFLYRGKIWIDAHDFALAHMEGEPARSPSFWVKDTRIDSTWQKVGSFWFIAHNRSVSHIRMGGTATLTIDYGDYEITSVGRAQGRSQSPQLPDPSSVTPER